MNPSQNGFSSSSPPRRRFLQITSSNCDSPQIPKIIKKGRPPQRGRRAAATATAEVNRLASRFNFSFSISQCGDLSKRRIISKDVSKRLTVDNKFELIIDEDSTIEGGVCFIEEELGFSAFSSHLIYSVYNDSITREYVERFMQRITTDIKRTRKWRADEWTVQHKLTKEISSSSSSTSTTARRRLDFSSSPSS